MKERNFRVQVLYAGLVFIVLAALRPPLLATTIVLFSVVLLLAAELANSSLERAVDLASPGFNVLAGEAKDLAAAAVMLTSFASAGVFMLVSSQQLVWCEFLGLGSVVLCLLLSRCLRGAAQ